MDSSIDSFGGDFDTDDVSLAALLNTPDTDIEEVYSRRLEPGKYIFKILAVEVEVLEGSIKRRCNIRLEVFRCEAFSPRKRGAPPLVIDKNDLVGAVFVENIPQFESMESSEWLGTILGFLTMATGQRQTGKTLRERVHAATGCYFRATVSPQKNKENPDQPYMRLDRSFGKITPYSPTEEVEEVD